MVRISYAGGGFIDAVIVAFEHGVIRVQIPGAPQVATFRYLLHDWVSDAGEAVGFDFEVDALRQCRSAAQRHWIDLDDACATSGDAALIERVVAALGPPS